MRFEVAEPGARVWGAIEPGGQWVVPLGGMLIGGLFGLLGVIGVPGLFMPFGLVGVVGLAGVFGLGAAVAVSAAAPSSNPARLADRYLMTSSLAWYLFGLGQTSDWRAVNPCAKPHLTRYTM
jgi:hypothetical protein